jgi:hypothetical protein
VRAIAWCVLDAYEYTAIESAAVPTDGLVVFRYTLGFMRRRPSPKRERISAVDHYVVLHGINVRGATEKDVLQDPDTGEKFIAKLGRRNNDLEVTTEYVIALVGRCLGVPIAGARIARYKGKLRFLSQYFLEEPHQELVHGLQLFNELYDDTSSTVRTSSANSSLISCGC